MSTLGILELYKEKIQMIVGVNIGTMMEYRTRLNQMEEYLLIHNL